ncbi:hypothetical protein [Burkholderia multivorans]|uniref:hypothetical protein n=1 Tax=Burkholderia multivorans TaxID=87883 RepID=UPI0009E0C929|nr:hypothetical protein [Burkholderia multivorans]MDN8078300.1 hypothetical protein [Burkholderia multivorans]SAJ91390.1 hypothetical protein UA11_04688 [Burkholderia multivorans]
MPTYDDHGAKMKALELVKTAIENGAIAAPAHWDNVRDPRALGESFGKFIGGAVSALADELKKL